MKLNSVSFIGSILLASALGTGCVTTGTHEAALAAEAEKQRMLQEKLEATNQELDTTKSTLGETEQRREELATKSEQLGAKLGMATQQNQQLITKVQSMGKNVEDLLGQKDSMAAERERLAAEVEEMRRMRAVTEARNAEFKKLLTKLQKMMDAGSLDVKIRNGLMVVTLPSDVLFSPGRAKLKPEAIEALNELAATLAGFGDRKFQVIGHSDSSPIHTARFPSNWELSSQRAIEVVRILVEAGVAPEMLSAAGAAEFDPIAPNDTPENMSLNRRVDLVFVPKIDEMPGFEEAMKK